MVKTTINLDDEIYAEIVKESIEKYGSTKDISKIINLRLRESTTKVSKRGKRVTFRAKEEFASMEADKVISGGWEGSSK